MVLQQALATPFCKIEMVSLMEEVNTMLLISVFISHLLPH